MQIPNKYLIGLLEAFVSIIFMVSAIILLYLDYGQSYASIFSDYLKFLVFCTYLLIIFFTLFSFIISIGILLEKEWASNGNGRTKFIWLIFFPMGFILALIMAFSYLREFFSS